ncbi:phage antirepressor KilAC domain-containing protein [Ligilactobacillus salivarius]|uniref:Oxidoreductase n=1 Tax=Ligilactobacillus salivarius TaxID=1624 RepID=A0ABD6JHZ0_9LACO|nr:phage antirepressor KilAC domain-containing protein [Ligilactobacillus salivarius]MYU71107.1 oxidoreductase [Ligilactobacillus salivarius]MYU78607.1 oxidoreductase [Ligilactobacillus salivarius]MYU96924.1 oxidoreductase [Ligilactobacillus salivarius]MYY23731.1 oxidoreductase [Ligilactobacillus salivarius]MYY40855.1 oxidoreductase [Ligilactobacillus salivarius]
MNELIKITIKNDAQVVSARDLYKELNVKTRFSLWVKQNFKHFRKDIDFTSVVTTTLVNNGAERELQDYALTIEMAKHIAMMSGTDKGYEIRDYFIKVEQAWNSPEMVMKRALEIANKKVEKLKLENQEMQPKALFADSVAASHTTILIGELAKILRGNGINIGANRLFQWMRDQGYLISRKGTDYNMPTQRSMNLGLFKIKESTITHSNGSVSISKTTKVTGKGQQYFINKFMKMNETAIG